MAGSKFAYVRNFELPDPLLPGTFMVFRLDGHSFHRCEISCDRIEVESECIELGSRNSIISSSQTIRARSN